MVVFPGLSERRACRVIGQARSTQRRRPKKRSDEDALTGRILELVSAYGRYGYRRITALLKREGWRVNHKRVERIWRQAGLKVPVRQKKRSRIWLNDGSCVRLRAEHVNHVWTYDFVHDRTRDGRGLKFLTVIDEYSRECLSILVRRNITSFEVLQVLADLFLVKGIPAYIRSDNGSEFIASQLRSWLLRLGASTVYIEPGSPWENGYIESFNGKFRDEFLAGELFDTLTEAKVLTDRWRRLYNQIRPHSSLGYLPPAPESFSPSHFGPYGASELRPERLYLA
jgi:Transposase and inactivated derivatives